jgi:hypothetical protein
METTDHALLATLLLSGSRANLSLPARLLFRFGCIEPDINKLTYLRGSLRTRMLRGHNAEITETHIKNKLERFTRRTKHSLLDWFVLGTTIHYIADSFTFAHNGRAFGKSLRKHIGYEKELSLEFRMAMECGLKDCHGSREQEPLALFSNLRKLYEKETPSLKNDCTYIVRSCVGVMDSLLPYPA